MIGTAEVVQALVLACVQCLIVTYGAITILVPLLKLRAAYQRSHEAVQNSSEAHENPSETQPQSA